jgi:uncharacterized RDD family membrane protein YckC
MADMDVNAVPVNATPMNDAPMAPVKYAGFWVRYVAYVVDSLILFIPITIIVLTVDIVFGLNSQSTNGRLIGEIFELLVIWTYFVWMTYAVGATLGKMLVGIRVHSDSFGKLSFGRVLLRETIGKFISGIIFLIGYIIAGFTDRKRALHDMFAHSVVVYKNPAKPHGAGLVIGVIIATILPILAILVILSSVVLVSLSTAREKSQEAQTQYQQTQAQEQVYVNQIQSSTGQ